MTTSGTVRGSILRLGEVGYPASLTLDILITLLVVALRIEKFISYPAFSLKPTNWHVSYVGLLRKLLSSELK